MDSRWLELLFLYGVAPVIFAVVVHRFNYRGAMAPVLWVVALSLGVTLARHPQFERSTLWRLPLTHPYVATMLIRFAVGASALLLIGRWLTPTGFLSLPRRRPGLWFALLLAYPTLSAVPQGVIWRVFFVDRYAGLFPERHWLICVGAAAFALAHLAFWNVPAIVVTAIGGALFLTSYLQTQSMLLAAAEHGAYGIVAFSAGLGTFLYRGNPLQTRSNATNTRLHADVVDH